ncbi:MAG: hypothetical protein ACLU6Y_00910 [Ruminococcus sp.]
MKVVIAIIFKSEAFKLNRYWKFWLSRKEFFGKAGCQDRGKNLSQTAERELLMP